MRFFGRDLALYRGESGKPVLLDAYCGHMGTHLAASDSAMIVRNGQQIEGDSIRCPYHGWRYNPDGEVDDIPYHEGPCPKSASIRSYPVVDNMGCIMAWYDPDGGDDGPAGSPPPSGLRARSSTKPAASSAGVSPTTATPSVNGAVWG